MGARGIRGATRTAAIAGLSLMPAIQYAELGGLGGTLQFACAARPQNGPDWPTRRAHQAVGRKLKHDSFQYR